MLSHTLTHWFTYFHTLFTHLWHNFFTLFIQFGIFLQIYANLNMLCFKKHILKKEISWIIFHTFTHYWFTHFQTIFTQFWLFLPNLSQFKHVWCLKTYNAAQDFNGDAFIQYNTNTILKTKLTNPKRTSAMVWIPGSTDASVNKMKVINLDVIIIFNRKASPWY